MGDFNATYTLATARTQVRDAIEFVSSGSYSDAQLDYYIKAACREFQRRVRPDVAVDTSVSTVSGQKYIDLPAGVTPAQVVRVEIVEDAVAPSYSLVQLVDYDSIRGMMDPYGGALRGVEPIRHHFLYPYAVGSGVARYGGFDREGRLWLHPAPDAAKTVRIHYWKEVNFSSTLNIPDDMMDGILFFGVPKYLGATLGDAGVSNRAAENFEKHIRECRGRVGHGPLNSLS